MSFNYFSKRMVSIFILLSFLFNTTFIYAKLSRDEYNQCKNEYCNMLDKAEKTREPSFWEKHKWKIIVGGLVVAGGIAIFCTGGAAAPVVTGGAACVSSAAVGGAALLSPSTLFLGGATLVLVGSNFSEKDLKTDGGKAFIGGSVIQYMKDNNIILTTSQKNYIKNTINKKFDSIVSVSKDKEDFLRRLDVCALEALKACK